MPEVDQHAEYHQALGVFVEMYANTERMAYVLLITLAGTDAPTSRSIWPSIRIKTAIDIMRRLHEARSEKVPQRLDEALSQLATITNLRDDILHYGTKPDNKGRLVNTEMYASTEARLKKFRVTPALLHALSTDLQVIACRMLTAMARPKADAGHQAQYDAAKVRAQDSFLYKPPQPTNKNQKTPTDAPIPKRQRKASRKSLQPPRHPK